MTDEQAHRRHIIEQARREAFEAISRVDQMLAGAQAPDFEDDRRDDLAEALSIPLETRNQRDARELQERDERWARERKRDDQAVEARLVALVDQRIAAVRGEIEALRHNVIEIARTTRAALKHLDDAIDLKGSHADTINERIERAFSRVEEKLDEIVPRRERGEPKAIVDMPNPLRAVN